MVTYHGQLKYRVKSGYIRTLSNYGYLLTLGNSLGKQKSLYKVLTASIKPSI